MKIVRWLTTKFRQVFCQLLNLGNQADILNKGNFPLASRHSPLAKKKAARIRTADSSPSSIVRLNNQLIRLKSKWLMVIDKSKIIQQESDG